MASVSMLKATAIFSKAEIQKTTIKLAVMLLTMPYSIVVAPHSSLMNVIIFLLRTLKWCQLNSYFNPQSKKLDHISFSVYGIRYVLALENALSLLAS